MDAPRQRQAFKGRLLILGFGCIGQGVLPLLLRHIDLQPQQILIICPAGSDLQVAREYAVPCLAATVTPENVHALLEPQLAAGDFLLNLSVGVSSIALIGLCQARGALYLDTSTEPWAGGYLDSRLSAAERTNYVLREAVLALRKEDGCQPTAVLTHGANPGLISHLLKQALLNLAQDSGLNAPVPESRKDWASLAAQLQVKAIHIAERDSQICGRRKQPDEFVNTWSVKSFVDEACQPAELGWGTHERHWPDDAQQHASGCKASIYLNRPGASTRVRTWTPLSGATIGFLVTHAESISIADYFTLRDGDRLSYRPTVHYAYHPCDDAVLSLHELSGRNWQLQSREHLLKDAISSGMDALGVLLLGHARGAYWFGSQLSIEQARADCPHNSATSLQVTAAVMAGVIWAMRNPARGLIEPDEMPFLEILDLCRPYLGELVGVYTDWSPLSGRGRLFEEDLDQSDPWQFKNVRVM